MYKAIALGLYALTLVGAGVLGFRLAEMTESYVMSQLYRPVNVQDRNYYPVNPTWI